MKKKLAINISIIIFMLILFFVPFVSNNVSLFQICDINSYLIEVNYSPNFIEHTLPYIIKTVVIISVLYFSFSTFLIISAIVKKKFIYIFLTSISLLGFFILYAVYGFMDYQDSSFQIKPSWSFYLSLLLLLGWIAYLFSPKWFPRLKKAFAGFRVRWKNHRAHRPTKSERIAELEKQVSELKGRDDSTSITSDREETPD